MFKKYFILSIVLIIMIIIPPFIYESHKENLTTKYNLAFITCFYGTSDNPAFKIPELPSDKYDCYYFSNNKDLLEKVTVKGWKPIYDDKPVTENLIESCMYGKRIKVLPHEFKILDNYQYLCFLDSKLDKISLSFVERNIDEYFIKGNYALLLKQHNFISPNVWNEFNESMKQERYVLEKEKYINYINNQLSKGLKPETQQHAQCGYLIRDMKHPKIIDLNNTWYKHIEECGIQDQISFFFVKQLFKECIHIFPESYFE